MRHIEARVVCDCELSLHSNCQKNEYLGFTLGSMTKIVVKVVNWASILQELTFFVVGGPVIKRPTRVHTIEV